MFKQPYWKKGDWNVLCDSCGFQRKSSEVQERWDGKMVCRPSVSSGCWETRHPLDLVRPPRPEKAVPWTRPEGADRDVGFGCTGTSINGVANVGTAGCMICDYDNGSRDIEITVPTDTL